MNKGLKLLTLAMLFAMPLAGCNESTKPNGKDDNDTQQKEDEDEDEEEEQGGGGGGQSGEIEHKGTQSDPYTVSDAYAIWSEFEAKQSSNECYVTGTVSSIKGVNNGRLQFYMNDGKCDEDLYVVNANNIGGSANCTESTIKKGDTVVVKGAIKAWAQDNDILFELCYEKDKAACELVSINGKGGSGGGGGSEGGGEGSGGGGGTVDPVTGDVVIDFSKTSSISGNVGSVTYKAEKSSAQNDPVVNSTSHDLRIYAKGKLTVSASSNMTQIDFAISAQGKKRQADISCSTGKMSYDMDNSRVSWTGNASSVVFTVGDTATHGSESSKAGQFCFTSMAIALGEGGGGSGEGGGGGSGDVDAVEAVAAYMAEALVGDATAYEYEDGSYYVDYYDDDSASIIAAAEYALSKCPDGFSVYEEVDEYDDDEGGTFAYGSYDDGVSIAIDVYSWENEGDICVEVEVYEFEYE